MNARLLFAVAVMLSSTILTMSNVCAFDVQRIFRDSPVPAGDINIVPLQPIDDADWIWINDGPENADETAFLRFVNDFEVSGTGGFELDVTSDERHVLFLDGKEISRGPHRGLPSHWYYQSYRIENLPEGVHRLEAVVWKLGANAPIAQLSWRGGFLLKASGDYDRVLTTGKGAWKVSRISRTKPIGKGTSGTYGAGSQFEVRGECFLYGGTENGGFVDPVVVRSRIRGNACGLRSDGWACFPTGIPDMIYRSCRPGVFRDGMAGSCLLRGESFHVPANTRIRLLWDLGDYYCADPELVASGGAGARISWAWAESLRDTFGNKGNRNEWKDKTASRAMTDVFLPDGRQGARFSTPWWRCGRWCEILVETAQEPLVLESLSILETRYPLENESSFSGDLECLSEIQSICVRGMQMCSHEMSMDCPYYEQQMYPGDSRVQFQIFSTMSGDSRLVRQNIAAYDYARRANGMIAMNFPTRGTQDSVTYSMCWLMMLRDLLWEYDDEDAVKSHLPGMRHTLSFLESLEAGGLLRRDLPGWSFVDWAGWKNGVPPANADDAGSVVNLYYALTLQACADVEEYFSEPDLALRLRRKAGRIAAEVVSRHWDDELALIAETSDRNSFCEHSQCLGILTGAIDASRLPRALDAMVRGDAPGWKGASVYFSHYVFDALLRHGRSDVFFDRLSLWKSYLALGLKTPIESPGGEARSDCHAWGAHPLYHLHRGVVGVRPLSACFREVAVAPSPGPLTRINAMTPHPKGLIRTNLSFDKDGGVKGDVTLPDGLSGMFFWHGRQHYLGEGRTEIVFQGEGR